MTLWVGKDFCNNTISNHKGKIHNSAKFESTMNGMKIKSIDRKAILGI
jgi:hypothetical protein